MSGLASDSSQHILRGIFIWETPLVVLILSPLCTHYINLFSSGGSALTIDWMKGSALGELMLSPLQLVDLDRLHHVTPVLSLVFQGLLAQSDSRSPAVSKRTPSAREASINHARRQANNTAQCSNASQLFWALPSLLGSRLRGIPKAPFA